MSPTYKPISASESQEAEFRLLGISGSLRSESFSTAVLRALELAAGPRASFEDADIGSVPHFDQDLYVEPLPGTVEKLRRQIEQSDGIVISSPEYNHGIPGVLKNALDWASRPHNGSPLKNKAALIVTSSPAFTGGVRAQYQLRESLVAALARPVNTAEIVVGLVAAKIKGGRFVDQDTFEFMRTSLATMFDEIEAARRARAVLE